MRIDPIQPSKWNVKRQAKLARSSWIPQSLKHHSIASWGCEQEAEMVLFESYQSLEQNQPTTCDACQSRSKDKIKCNHWNNRTLCKNENTLYLVPNLPITWPQWVPERVKTANWHPSVKLECREGAISINWSPVRLWEKNHNHLPLAYTLCSALLQEDPHQ